ncbi:MAG: hypothetical protein JWP08_4378 [Bryobacterales bacterium]|nr:hypothetical protein [Bryobacterales bacterium]
MPEIGRDFEQRLENESPLQHAGVRNGQLWSLNDVVTVEQQVQINEARSFRTASACATALVFDSLQDSKKLQREIAGFADCHEIEEPGLVADILWFGLVKRRAPDDMNVFAFEASQSFV